MAIATGTALLGSAIIGGMAANRASKSQAGAADRAGALQKEVADEQVALQREQFNRQLELQAPFREAGVNALNKLAPLASEYTPFGMAQFQQDPGYAFRMSEGMKALERGAASRGGLMSGATMKGLQRYGQDLASQEYQNAFNRYGVERERRLNPLQSLAGVGQTSAQQVGQAGQNMTAGIGGALGAYGQGASQAMGAAAQARASGYVGGANSLSGALGQYMNYNQQEAQNERFNRLLDERRGGYGSGYGAMGPQYGQAPLDASFNQYRGSGVTDYSDFDGGIETWGGYGANFGRSPNAFSNTGDY
jgi:hypothetical protein